LNKTAFKAEKKLLGRKIHKRSKAFCLLKIHKKNQNISLSFISSYERKIHLVMG